MAIPDQSGSTQFPSTIRDYFLDSYQFKSLGTVLDIKAGDDGSSYHIVLDRTIFHPQGGGQPSDSGTITDGSTVFTVRSLSSNRDTNVIDHIGVFSPGSTPFQVQQSVQLEVDENARRVHARLHSAGHLLDEAMKRIRPDLTPSKGCHFPGNAWVDYMGEIAAGDRANAVKSLQSAIDDVIGSGLDVSIEMNGDRRSVSFGGGLSCECGGTHVKFTNDIGRIKVDKIQKAKGGVRVKYSIGDQTI